MSTIKQYCEEILMVLHKIQVGECSMKGFLAHKLYVIRKKLNNLHMTSLEMHNHDNQLAPSV